MRRVNHQQLSRRAVIAFAGALLATLTGVAPAAANADGERFVVSAPTPPEDDVPAGFTTWTGVFAVQDELNAAAEKIVAARDGGYAGIVASPRNRELHVYWKGQVPEPVLTLAGGLGVPVRFLEAAHSEQELLAETARLVADPDVRSAGPEVDGSGLRVNVTAAGRRAVESGEGILGTATVPVHVESDAAPAPLSRQNDSSPYWGGARYTTPLGACSTGFAIKVGGLDHMLSAGHCGNNGHVATDGGGNAAVDTMGSIFNDVAARDTLLIDTWAAGSAYVGAFGSNVAVDVVGAVADFVGNVVCTSGARTGEHCGLTVTHVNQTDAGFAPLTRAVHPSDGCAAARGDSGGPVFHYNAANALVGRGTISTGRPGTASCPNAPVSDSSSVVYYAPLLRPAGDPHIGSLQFYGAGIL